MIEIVKRFLPIWWAKVEPVVRRWMDTPVEPQYLCAFSTPRKEHRF